MQSALSKGVAPVENTKTTIGRNVRVDLVGHVEHVLAKVDTGADSSSIWASAITMLPNGTLQFTLFDKSSPYYDNQVIETTDYSVVAVRSSTGHQQIRYRVPFSMRIKGRRIRGVFNLADRSRNQYPILIGRRTLNNRFIVDVALADDSYERPLKKVGLNDELVRNPYEFYKKYHGRDV